MLSLAVLLLLALLLLLDHVVCPLALLRGNKLALKISNKNPKKINKSTCDWLLFISVVFEPPPESPKKKVTLSSYVGKLEKLISFLHIFFSQMLTTNKQASQNRRSHICLHSNCCAFATYFFALKNSICGVVRSSIPHFEIDVLLRYLENIHTAQVRRYYIVGVCLCALHISFHIFFASFYQINEQVMWKSKSIKCHSHA